MKYLKRVASLLDMIIAFSGGITAISNIVHAMSQIRRSMDEKPRDKSFAFTKEYSEIFRRNLSELQHVAEQLNLDATLHSIAYCNDLFNRGHIKDDGKIFLGRDNMERLENALDGLRNNFLAQMNSRLVFVVDTKYADYLNQNILPFGKDVEDIFPKVSEEISEAAKCLALQRPTAVVFHLMRAMELAVQRLADSLGVKNIEKEWGKLLSEISRAIEIMPKGPNRDAWSQSHSHLYHVKQAWRNDTMHPKTTYTEEQAENVFEAVKSFMVHLAPLVSGKE